MKRLIILYFSLIYPMAATVLAQNDADVMRMSQYFQGATARSAAMGGAFGALGGDLSSISINPAGLGVYRKSEFVFTPYIGYDKSIATFYGQDYEDFKYKFRMNNMGLVISNSTNKDKGWVSANFAFTYNKLADFNRNITIKADETQSSLLDEFVFYADGLSDSELNPNYEGLAWDADLMFIPDATNYPGVYAHDMNFPQNPTDPIENWVWISNYNQSQVRNVVTKGGIDEYAFSFGTNFSHKLFLGASFVINRVFYDEQKLHSENDVNNSIDYLSGFDFDEYFNYRGTGYSFNAGAIVKPVDMLRLGLSVHLPTFYNLESEFYTRMNSYFDEGDPLEMNTRSELTVSDFQVITPLRLNTSVGFQIGKVALLSLDYELVNYKTARIDDDYSSYDDINDNIQKDYKSTGNLRAGAEVMLGSVALRGGYGFYGSPYDAGMLNEKSNTNVLSTGIGFRGDHFFCDLAYSLTMRPMKHTMYYAGFEGPKGTDYYADVDMKTTRVMATLGFKF